MPTLASILQEHWVLLLSIALIVLVCNRLLTPPAELAHLPRVPVLPLLWSYFTGEVEDVRIKRLFMPFAERGEGVVLVYALGRWIVHVLDEKVRLSPMLCFVSIAHLHKIARDISADITTWPKEEPPGRFVLLQIENQLIYYYKTISCSGAW